MTCWVSGGSYVEETEAVPSAFLDSPSAGALGSAPFGGGEFFGDPEGLSAGARTSSAEIGGGNDFFGGPSEDPVAAAASEFGNAATFGEATLRGDGDFFGNPVGRSENAGAAADSASFDFFGAPAGSERGDVPEPRRLFGEDPEADPSGTDPSGTDPSYPDPSSGDPFGADPFGGGDPMAASASSGMDVTEAPAWDRPSQTGEVFSEAHQDFTMASVDMGEASGSGGYHEEGQNSGYGVDSMSWETILQVNLIWLRFLFCLV